MCFWPVFAPRGSEGPPDRDPKAYVDTSHGNTERGHRTGNGVRRTAGSPARPGRGLDWLPTGPQRTQTGPKMPGNFPFLGSLWTVVPVVPVVPYRGPRLPPSSLGFKCGKPLHIGKGS